MGVQYSVTFINKSTQSGNAMVFQQDPNITNPNVFSLAWFSKYTHPNTNVTFTWSIDYSFVWSETGQLVPGVQFSASQVAPANLTSTNQITLTRQDGAYMFDDQKVGPKPGTLYITEDGTIPPNMAAVGIGMSGFGTFVQQAQPNMNLTFTPHPEYWIAFGSYSQGQVLDIGSINNPAQIDFPPGVYSMVAILNADNTWTIQSQAEANARLVAAKKRLAQAGIAALL